jgi:hypothetical protein
VGEDVYFLSWLILIRYFFKNIIFKFASDVKSGIISGMENKSDEKLNMGLGMDNYAPIEIIEKKTLNNVIVVDRLCMSCLKRPAVKKILNSKGHSQYRCSSCLAKKSPSGFPDLRRNV